MWNLHQKGKKFIFVDETHWEIGNRCGCGWSQKGEKSLSSRPFQRTKFTSVAAITSLGETFAQVYKGTVTSSVFNDFFSCMINWHSGVSCDKVVIYLDNAPIHSPPELKRIAEEAGHTVAFGPKYSPEMNPIEFIFGVWKKQADTVILSQELSNHNIVQGISDSFYSLSGEELRAAVSHVFVKVYKRVFDGENI